jgi:hypothetical protein
MSLVIDRFRNWASIEFNIYLPEPDDLALIEKLEIEISKHQNQEFV